jgi:hypothetical protein
MKQPDSLFSDGVDDSSSRLGRTRPDSSFPSAYLSCFWNCTDDRLQMSFSLRSRFYHKSMTWIGLVPISIALSGYAQTPAGPAVPDHAATPTSGAPPQAAKAASLQSPSRLPFVQPSQPSLTGSIAPLPGGRQPLHSMMRTGRIARSANRFRRANGDDYLAAF